MLLKIGDSVLNTMPKSTFFFFTPESNGFKHGRLLLDEDCFTLLLAAAIVHLASFRRQWTGICVPLEGEAGKLMHVARRLLAILAHGSLRLIVCGSFELPPRYNQVGQGA